MLQSIRPGYWKSTLRVLPIRQVCKKDQLLALDGQTLVESLIDKGVANVPPDQELSLRVQRGDEEFTQSLKLPGRDLLQCRLDSGSHRDTFAAGDSATCTSRWSGPHQGLLVADIVPEGPPILRVFGQGVLIECQDQPVEDILSLARQIHGMKRGSEINLRCLCKEGLEGWRPLGERPRLWVCHSAIVLGKF